MEPLIPEMEGGGETILVVEDDPLVRAYVNTQLQSLGYKTLSAANGVEALAIVDSGAAFDLLFTDVIMPGRLNGRQLAAEMEQRHASLKVLFTSGYTENAITHHGRLDSGSPSQAGSRALAPGRIDFCRKCSGRKPVTRTAKLSFEIAVLNEGVEQGAACCLSTASAFSRSRRQAQPQSTTRGDVIGEISRIVADAGQERRTHLGQPLQAEEIQAGHLGDAAATSSAVPGEIALESEVVQ